jgi:DNA-nicking Smr family endonuclease
MAKRHSAHRGAADDATADAGAFRAAVRDVTPLPQTAPAAGLQKPRPRPGLRRAAAPSIREDLDEMMPLIDPHPASAAEAPQDAVTNDGALSFQRPGVRIQVMRRLRRGLYPIEDELDLHGQTQTGARDRLADFIAQSRERGCRCVRVIHGKGYRSGVRGPVLKTAVNLWLRRHLDVMAFVSARAIDGGAGALYVLLRA